MIIRINDKNGKEIAACEFIINEYGTMLVLDKKGTKSIFHDQEQGKSGFTDVMEIDLE